MKTILALGMLLALPESALSGPAQDEPKAVAAVWAREGEYWSAASAGDTKRYLRLFHKSFTGWPCGQSAPVQQVTLAPPPAGGSETVILDEKAQTASGNLVMVFYRATLSDHLADGRTETRTRYFTHTWIPGEGGWQILGGMCRDVATK
jgi:hypothetical protein